MPPILSSADTTDPSRALLTSPGGDSRSYRAVVLAVLQYMVVLSPWTSSLFWSNPGSLLLMEKPKPSVALLVNWKCISDLLRTKWNVSLPCVSYPGIWCADQPLWLLHCCFLEIQFSCSSSPPEWCFCDFYVSLPAVLIPSPILPGCMSQDFALHMPRTILTVWLLFRKS